MQICVSSIAMSLICLWHVIVDDMLNVREVQALRGNIRGHKHILAPLLEPVYGLIPLSLILATFISRHTVG